MNTYDFDGTIYVGDSTIDFYLFCLRKSPRLLGSVPCNVGNAVRFKLGGLSRQEFKQRYFQLLLPKIPVDRMLGLFWESHRSRLLPWYLRQREDSDVVISASPEFLLQPVCAELGVSLIATKVNDRTGVLEGPNMRGQSKVDAMRRQYPEVIPDAFYTDSLSDLPMLRYARKGFIVRKGAIRQFEE